MYILYLRSSELEKRVFMLFILISGKSVSFASFKNLIKNVSGNKQENKSRIGLSTYQYQHSVLSGIWASCTCIWPHQDFYSLQCFNPPFSYNSQYISYGIVSCLDRPNRENHELPKPQIFQDICHWLLLWDGTEAEVWSVRHWQWKRQSGQCWLSGTTGVHLGTGRYTKHHRSFCR